jgi:hypothetical protein
MQGNVPSGRDADFPFLILAPVILTIADYAVMWDKVRTFL